MTQMTITQGVNAYLTNILYLGDDIGSDLTIEFDAPAKRTVVSPNIELGHRISPDRLLHTGQGPVTLRATITESDFAADDFGSKGIHIEEYGSHALTVSVNEAVRVVGWSEWYPSLRRAISHVQASFVCELFASYAGSGASSNMPSFSNLVLHYPAYDRQASPAVKKVIGGKVDYPWIENTCAIRMSRALNHTMLVLPNDNSSLHVVSGADGKWYSYRVAELREWLIDKIGNPQFDHGKEAGTPFDKKILKDVRGILLFEIRFSNATGHFDLWDGSEFTSERSDSRNSAYWSNASRISLWEAS